MQVFYKLFDVFFEGLLCCFFQVIGTKKKSGRLRRRSDCEFKIGVSGLLLVKQLEVLNVDGLHLRGSSLYRRLLEVLAGAKLADGTGLLEFSLEFLQSPFDVLAFLDRNYDHNAFTTSFFFYKLGNIQAFPLICHQALPKAGAKIGKKC